MYDIPGHWSLSLWHLTIITMVSWTTVSFQCYNEYLTHFFSCFSFTHLQKRDKNRSVKAGEKPHKLDVDGLEQERCNSSALAMELHLSCAKPSIWSSDGSKPISDPISTQIPLDYNELMMKNLSKSTTVQVGVITTHAIFSDSCFPIPSQDMVSVSAITTKQPAIWPMSIT